jgi:hypothetical protein
MAVHEVVTNLLQSGNYLNIKAVLDQSELDSPQPNVLEDWPHAAHLLSHIYAGDLCSARFLWKRIPDAAKQNNPELEATWRLLQFYWNKHYQGVWQALQGFPWSAPLRALTDALAAKLRQELLDLISTAYATITPAKAASLIGLSEQDALSTCCQLGWGYDPASGMLTVVPKQPSAGEKDGLANLEQLAEYMVHLEAQ